MKEQDAAAAKDKLQKELNELIAKLENNRVKVNGRDVLTGKLNNDQERALIQAALQMDVGGGPAVLGRYYANDEPMQNWLKRQT